MFNIYTQPLGKIAKEHGVNYLFYADDTQLYISFFVKESNTSVNHLTECIGDIRSWMQCNWIMLNDSKTEVMLLGARQQLSRLIEFRVSVGSTAIKAAKLKTLVLFSMET